MELSPSYDWLVEGDREQKLALVLDIDEEEAALLAYKVRADAEIRRRSKITARSNSMSTIPEGKEACHAQGNELGDAHGTPFVVPLGA